MKEIWKTIKGFAKYEVSNKGKVRNKKTKHVLKQFQTSPHSKLLSVHLSDYHCNRNNTRAVHKLVAQHFERLKPGDTTAHHTNYVQFDNRAPNLEGTTQWEAVARTRRHNADKAGKIRGIYRYEPTGLPERHCWRAAVSFGDMKPITLGYSKEKSDVVALHYIAYALEYGVEPYNYEEAIK